MVLTKKDFSYKSIPAFKVENNVSHTLGEDVSKYDSFGMDIENVTPWF